MMREVSMSVPSGDGSMWTRRRFLHATTSALGASALSAWGSDTKPIRVAAIVTSFTHRSHAHVILENFLEDYPFNGQRTSSGCQVVSLFTDQHPEGDMAPAVAKEYRIAHVPTIREALTLGGKSLAVDGVLSIGEHGEYPYNEKKQHQYPRKRFFDEIVATFREVGGVCPVFNDKHLSYRWDWSKEMADVSRSMGFALMAGSSVPLAERRPSVELPDSSPITAAVSIHGGGLESYDFHGLEVLQSMVEARRGGEVGVARVEFLGEEKLWQKGEAGAWSIPLADAAMRAELGPEAPGVRELSRTPRFANPHGILITYRDGFQALMLKFGEDGIRWNFACQIDGEKEPRATRFHVGPWQNRNLFKALSHAIQIHFREKKPPYPMERTLLTSGILSAAMDSRFEGEKPVDTPWLNIAYPPIDFRRCREMGQTWKQITDQTPEPAGMHRFFGSSS
ncbi:hypothetical protein K2X85_16325 [bacterium]|nr:hypothetical protein [bacterium]